MSKRVSKKDQKDEKINIEIKKDIQNDNKSKKDDKKEFPGVTLKEIELVKDLRVKLVLLNSKEYVDIRRYDRDFPTKKGIMIARNIFKKIQEVDFNKVDRSENENESEKYAKEIKKVSINDDIKVSLLLYKEKEYVDISKYYNEFPMKKGIRIFKETFLKLVNLDLDKF